MIAVIEPSGQVRCQRVPGKHLEPSIPNRVDSQEHTNLGGSTMANRRFEMFQYRQVIHRMRMGQSDRAIAKSGLMGRLKCALVRAIAEKRAWLSTEVPLPDDTELATVFSTETVRREGLYPPVGCPAPRIRRPNPYGGHLVQNIFSSQPGRCKVPTFQRNPADWT